MSPAVSSCMGHLLHLSHQAHPIPGSLFLLIKRENASFLPINWANISLLSQKCFVIPGRDRFVPDVRAELGKLHSSANAGCSRIHR